MAEINARKVTAKLVQKLFDFGNLYISLLLKRNSSQKNENFSVLDFKNCQRLLSSLNKNSCSTKRSLKFQNLILIKRVGKRSASSKNKAASLSNNNSCSKLFQKVLFPLFHTEAIPHGTFTNRFSFIPAAFGSKTISSKFKREYYKTRQTRCITPQV